MRGVNARERERERGRRGMFGETAEFYVRRMESIQGICETCMRVGFLADFFATRTCIRRPAIYTKKRRRFLFFFLSIVLDVDIGSSWVVPLPSRVHVYTCAYIHVHTQIYVCRPFLF